VVALSMMKIIRLKGLTGHGKNRIREHSELWEVIETTLTPKPIFPPIKSLKTGEWQWLDDINFKFRLESTT